jgi:hypothetical protein
MLIKMKTKNKGNKIPDLYFIYLSEKLLRLKCAQSTLKRTIVSNADNNNAKKIIILKMNNNCQIIIIFIILTT